eukprot:Nk52_evm61s215 gene=Nk52_evmTU61s215
MNQLFCGVGRLATACSAKSFTSCMTGGRSVATLNVGGALGGRFTLWGEKSAFVKAVSFTPVRGMKTKKKKNSKSSQLQEAKIRARPAATTYASFRPDEKVEKVEMGLVEEGFQFGFTDEELGDCGEDVKRMFALDLADAKTKLAEAKRRAMARVGRHESDTGSPEAQVAAITVRILNLLEWCKANHKDKCAKRKLQEFIRTRRTHLLYLKRRDPVRYLKLLEELQIKYVRPTPKYNFGYGGLTP